jgi:hypothetical protein
MCEAQEYRYRAFSLREAAQKTSDLAAREQLEVIAGDYDAMADELEHRFICSSQHGVSASPLPHRAAG